MAAASGFSGPRRDVEARGRRPGFAARIGAVLLAGFAAGGSLLVAGHPPSAAMVPAASAAAAPLAQTAPARGAVAGAPAPAVEASSAVLMDAASGRVLYAKNARRRTYPASVTKILTAYVVLRAALAPGGGGLDAEVTVSRRAADTPGSSMGLRPGDRATVDSLLYGLLLVSGNDAAEALAEHVAGSPAAFADMLNAAAARLGCTATHFTNPSGLPGKQHVTTALDLARITAAALALPDFSAIVATRRAAVAVGDRTMTLYNENRLLGQGGVDGVKTGYTTQAGQTYVASATRGDLRLIAVVIGASRAGKYSDAARLLDWGFAEAHAAPLPPAGRVAAQTQIAHGTAFYVDLVLPPSVPASVALWPGERLRITTTAPEVARPPIRKGQALGTLTVWVSGAAVGTWPLLAAWPVGRAGPAALHSASRPGATAPAASGS